MKKIQNCLFVTRQGVYLHKEGEAVIVSQKDEENNSHTLLKLPLRAIRNIFCFGNIMISPHLMAYCGDQGILISFFTFYGQYKASVLSPQKGSILVRIEQYRLFFDSEGTTSLSKNIIAAKIDSERQLLLRHLRTYGYNTYLHDATLKLKISLNKLRSASSIDLLRGYEGDSARIYFSVFPYLIRNSAFTFTGRNRRPPQDPINALLSFFYSILQQEIAGALQSVGLDSQLGFLHRPRPGRNSLALDLLEELRTPVVDRFVLSLINRSQIAPSDFNFDSIEGCTLKENFRKKVLEIWQSRKFKEIIHPYLKEKVYIGLLPQIQASLMASYFRKDMEFYPPYIMR